MNVIVLVKMAVFLLSDSSLLFSECSLGGIDFWTGHVRGCLQMKAEAKRSPICAVYIGASNGDVQEYFEIFESAMERIGVRHQCHHLLMSTGSQTDFCLLF